jgi:hypothetical protein
MNDEHKQRRLQKQGKAWNMMRARGRLKFILYRGVALFGGLMFIFTTAINIIVRHQKETVGFFLVDAVVWGFAGLLWALWTWSRYERAFRGSNGVTATRSGIGA